MKQARRRWIGGAALSLAVLLATGCPSSERADEEATMEEPTEEMAPDTAMETTPADTTAEALWAHVQQEAYARNWAFWPDREPFYQGTEPHGALLNTYLNPAAEQGLSAMRAAMGEG